MFHFILSVKRTERFVYGVGNEQNLSYLCLMSGQTGRERNTPPAFSAAWPAPTPTNLPHLPHPACYLHLSSCGGWLHLALL